MIIDILTIFPSFFNTPLKESLLGKAIEKRIISIRVHDIRQYATDKHKTVDDRPYGGGAGMVMKVEPIVRAIEALQKLPPKGWILLLSPQGNIFTQKKARQLSSLPRLILICGRYEGIDDRISNFIDEEVSIGDYVLSGGEVAALVLIDAVARLIPGVVGNVESVISESFERCLLEYPQFTRPRDFRGYKVPEILISGNHEAIRRWRIKQSILRTKKRRPDLFSKAVLTDEEKAILHEIEEGNDQ
ncbi:MAG TPA: tRNA (guanosine(37)-N1)-methyltransferase TrmD [Thermodesulforhabdus norvegica]|uniref:tRNA (guanine-N(1)-)-methyltransferase n=1 Tax=Thermodesulforhabdus norvegica TaxID=39841 RepID=A0A7C0WRG2_9BACT|nr:tRNA (guanosine(37)-N1)-methyltransferase TrmD [Thermodesulforhabdus norvegica]